MHRRSEFSFPGSPARGLPPRPPVNTVTPRYGEEEVRWLQASRKASPDYSSGTPSPQMWAYNPDHHLHHHRPYPASAGTSPSRAEAIAGYRRQMLDLVRGLPESAYELSLRDIVEHPLSSSSSSSPPTHPDPVLPRDANVADPRRDDAMAAAAAVRKHELAAGGRRKDAAVADGEVDDGNKKKQSWYGKKQGRKQRTTMRKQRSLERSVSLDTGLLIKFFLPLSIGRKKKVSPKPDAAKDGKKKNKEKNKEKEKQGKKKKEAMAAAAAQEEESWSKSGFSEAGTSSRTNSTGSSNSSGGSIGNGHVNGSVDAREPPSRSWSRKPTGCYTFFRANKNKNVVGQE